MNNDPLLGRIHRMKSRPVKVNMQGPLILPLQILPIQ